MTSIMMTTSKRTSIRIASDTGTGEGSWYTHSNIRETCDQKRKPPKEKQQKAIKL